ncbi:MAG: GAF domain-containing protein [Desulfovibrionales bacterium]
MYGNNCLAKILGIVCNVFDAYSAVLFLPESEEEYFLAASFSLGDNILPDTRIHSGKGLVGWIIRNRRPLLVNNFDRTTNCLGYYNSESESKIKAFMGCPMSGGLGALCLDSKKTYSFSERDQKILHQFTQLIESVQSSMCNANFVQQERRFYGSLSAIHELREKNPRWSDFLSGFLTILSRNTGYQFAFLAVRDEWGKTYYLEGWNQPLFEHNEEGARSFPMGSGLIGWVFKNNSSVFTGDKESGPVDFPVFGKEVAGPSFKSVICLPLIMNKKARGVLVLADRENLRVSDNLKSFLFLVSDYLATFLENLYLKNKMTMLVSDLKSNNS